MSIIDKVLLTLYGGEKQYNLISSSLNRKFTSMKNILEDFEDWKSNFYDETIRVSRFNNLQFDQFARNAAEKLRLKPNLQIISEIKEAIMSEYKKASKVQIQNSKEIIYIFQ